jgi:hypothetical protein
MKYLSVILTAFLIFSFLPCAYPQADEPEMAGPRDAISEDIIDEDNPQDLPDVMPRPISDEATPLPQKPNPRIMVITVEYIDGIEQPASITQSKMEESFLASDFPLIDKSQMEMIKERDAVLSFSDPNRAAALGRNYGAETVVVVEAKANATDTAQPYGVRVYTYECDATAKAIKVDTAEVMTSRSSSAIERGRGRIPTASKACEKAVVQLADEIIAEINQQQRGAFYKETTVQLVCSNADYAKVKEFAKALDEQRSIKAVYERGIERNVAILDVELLGNADFLADLLTEMQNGPLFKITAKSEHRIDLGFIE